MAAPLACQPADLLSHLPPDLLARLRKAGCKITPARLAVINTVLAEGQHRNAADILRQAQALHPHTSRATVYRTLELLTELGIVRPIYVGENGPTYIRAEGGHHHLVCAQCGKIVDFDQCGADSLGRELEARFGFHIHSHRLEFYGLCAECYTGV